MTLTAKSLCGRLGADEPLFCRCRKRTTRGAAAELSAIPSQRRGNGEGKEPVCTAVELVAGADVRLADGGVGSRHSVRLPADPIVRLLRVSVFADGSSTSEGFSGQRMPRPTLFFVRVRESYFRRESRVLRFI